MSTFTESEERIELRRQVARLAKGYGREWFTERARAGEKTTELWMEIAKAGYLGVNIPEQYGGGGGGIGDVAAVCEELAAQGCPLLMMVVSPAICGTVIARYGTEEQKQRWLPGICDGTGTMAFAITEPDAGTNSHNITTTARRDGDEWVLKGQKIYISGVDEAANVLVVARAEDARTGKLKPCLFVVPTDSAGLEFTAIPMEIVSPELQFQVFIDDVRLPRRRDRRRRGRRPGAAVRRAQPRADHGGLLLDRPGPSRPREGVGVRQGAHRLQGSDRLPPGDRPPPRDGAHRERARPPDDAEGVRAGRRGRRHGGGRGGQHGEVRRCRGGRPRRRRAVQTHGGNGITQEYGMAGMLVAARAGRIAPVSREMILNFVAIHSLGLPKSY